MPAEADWLSACRRVVRRQRELLAASPTIAGRTRFAGRGEGGDEALVIDRSSEDLVFDEIESIAAEGVPLTAISEERGEVRFGGGGERFVVIDPLDGSLNARRTLPPHALSIAVASGPSMADVEFAFVHDYGSEEEFVAVLGRGARLDGEPLVAEGPGRGLEVVGLESTNPEWLVGPVGRLAGRTWRVRAVGAIAISLSYVAAARFDAMLSVRPCRSVDAAAAQLIVREAGALVEFDGVAPAGAPLSLGARFGVAAALDEEMMQTIREVRDGAG